MDKIFTEFIEIIHEGFKCMREEITAIMLSYATGTDTIPNEGEKNDNLKKNFPPVSRTCRGTSNDH